MCRLLSGAGLNNVFPIRCGQWLPQTLNRSHSPFSIASSDLESFIYWIMCRVRTIKNTSSSLSCITTNKHSVPNVMNKAVLLIVDHSHCTFQLGLFLCCCLPIIHRRHNSYVDCAIVPASYKAMLPATLRSEIRTHGFALQLSCECGIRTEIVSNICILLKRTTSAIPAQWLLENMFQYFFVGSLRVLSTAPQKMFCMCVHLEPKANVGCVGAVLLMMMA